MKSPSTVPLILLTAAGVIPRRCMRDLLRKVWSDIEGLDVAEYAVMGGAVLLLVFGLMRAL